MKRNKIALAGLRAGRGGYPRAGRLRQFRRRHRLRLVTPATRTAIITTNGSEPENPLIPTNTNEVGGGKILDSIFAGLVYYDGDGKPVNDMAESITVDDPQHLTVKLKEGQTFTDGEEVTADNFIKAWNYGALLSNAQPQQLLLRGHRGLQLRRGLRAHRPRAGRRLHVHDRAEQAGVRTSRCASATRRYYPLPDVAFEDMEAFGADPDRQRPVQARRRRRVAARRADRPRQERGLQGWPRGAERRTDVHASTPRRMPRTPTCSRGNVDVIDAIPPSALATFEDDLGDRAVNQPAAVFQSFTIPQPPRALLGRRGQAASPGDLDGDQPRGDHRHDLQRHPHAGERLHLARHRRLVRLARGLRGAGVQPRRGQEAVGRGRRHLAVGRHVPDRVQLRRRPPGLGRRGVRTRSRTRSASRRRALRTSTSPRCASEVNDRTIKTAFRTGWQADYPGLYNFLGPLYATDAGSNDGDYSNPEFDAAPRRRASRRHRRGRCERGRSRRRRRSCSRTCPRSRCGTRT